MSSETSSIPPTRLDDELEAFGPAEAKDALYDVNNFLSSRRADPNELAPCVCHNGNSTKCTCITDLTNTKLQNKDKFNDTLLALASLAYAVTKILQMDEAAQLLRLKMICRCIYTVGQPSPVYLDLDKYYHDEARSTEVPQPGKFVALANVPVREGSAEYVVAHTKMICLPSAVYFLRQIMRYKYGYFGSPAQKVEAQKKIDSYHVGGLFQKCAAIGNTFDYYYTKNNRQIAWQARVLQFHLLAENEEEMQYAATVTDEHGEVHESIFPDALNINVDGLSDGELEKEAEKYARLVQDTELHKRLNVLDRLSVQRAKKQNGCYDMLVSKFPAVACITLENKFRFALLATAKLAPANDDGWTTLDIGGRQSLQIHELRGETFLDIWQDKIPDLADEMVRLEAEDHHGTQSDGDTGLLPLAQEFNSGNPDQIIPVMSRQITYILTELVSQAIQNREKWQFPPGYNHCTIKFYLMRVMSTNTGSITMDMASDKMRCNTFHLSYPLTNDGIFMELFPDQAPTEQKKEGELFHQPQQVLSAIWGQYARTDSLMANDGHPGAHMRLVIQYIVDCTEHPGDQLCSVVCGEDFKHSESLPFLEAVLLDGRPPLQQQLPPFAPHEVERSIDSNKASTIDMTGENSEDHNTSSGAGGKRGQKSPTDQNKKKVAKASPSAQSPAKQYRNPIQRRRPAAETLRVLPDEGRILMPDQVESQSRSQTGK